MSRLLAGFSTQALVKLLDLQLVLFLQFFQTQIRSSLVVAHVVVPCARKLEELRSLSAFNRYQFLLLRLTHVLKLPKHLFVLEVVEF